MSVHLTLPLRTVSEANRASHEHWAKRAKRAKEQRSVTRMALAARPDWPPRHGNPAARLVVLTRIAPRALDLDNLQSSFKHIRDGVADALGVDDGSETITWDYAQRKGKPKEYAVEIDVR